MSRNVKYKQKLTTLDVAAQVASLRPKLLGKRVANIYDIDKKNYLFKIGNGEEKEVLHIEVGVHFNTTLKDYDKKTIPSGLTMRIRKNLKSKRVEAIDQLGVERVVRIQFGSGDATYYLFLEFYAKGNMVLTDKDLTIICVTRSFEYSETEKVAVGSRYPVEKSASLKLEDIEVSKEEIERCNVNGRDGKLPRANDLYFSILKCCHMGMINPILLQFEIKPNEELKDQDKAKFYDALKYGYSIFERPTSGSGYLLRIKDSHKEDTTESGIQAPQIHQSKDEESGQIIVIKKGLNYFDLTPVLFEDYSQQPDIAVEEYPDFDEAMRTYFENVILVSAENKDNFQSQAWKKYENMKDDQETRLRQIKESIDDYYLKAQLIENNITEIQAIIDIVNALIEIGMTSIIKGVISQARKQGDPLANIIKEYNILERRVTVYLGNEDELEDSLKVIDINVNKTPFENARYYYDLRATMIDKEKKTLEATGVTLKIAKDAAEKKIKKKEETIKAVKVNRKIQWFEKFYWFVSSENYLVISARDAHQNETLIKKYLAKDDIVFHTQVQGSAFSLVKNPKGGPIPHQTLQEAATATLCHSRCWDQKIVSEVFWVFAEQVSKTAPTGQFVGLGSFMVYGKKNFITPSRLEMGFGLIFRVDEESAKNHEGERKRRDEGNETDYDDPERLIKQAQVVESPNFKKKGADDAAADGKKTTPAQADQAAEGDDDDLSNQGAEGGDSSDEDTVPALSSHPSQLTVSRALTIGKDTESYYVLNPIATTKSTKTQQTQKKKEKDQKKAGAQPGGKDAQAGKGAKEQPPAKPTLQTIDVKKGQQMSKNKKNRVEKMKEKYGEMDEEERRVQMEMLGAKGFKLSKDQQKGLERKLKGQRGERLDEEDEEEVAEEVEVETAKTAKGKPPSDKKDDSKNQAAQKNQKAGQQKGQGQKGQNDKSGSQKAQQKNGNQKGAQADAKKPVQTKDEAPKHSNLIEEKSEEKNTEDITEQKPESLPKPIAELRPAGEEEEEELEDLGGDDQDDSEDNDANEVKKETMSVLNTVLDEEAERNLNETLEFKDYTGVPKNNDGLLESIPVCAPYSSMVGYKYRVKVVPGTMKKGKAARQAMQFFENLKEATNIEKALIKGVDENYAISQILGNSKVQGAGVTKSKLNDKASKKAAAKKRDADNAKKE